MCIYYIHIYMYMYVYTTYTYTRVHKEFATYILLSFPLTLTLPRNFSKNFSCTLVGTNSKSFAVGVIEFVPLLDEKVQKQF